MAFQSSFVNRCSGTELETVSKRFSESPEKAIYYLSLGEPRGGTTFMGWPAHCSICRDVAYSAQHTLWLMPNQGEGHL